jgi:hypothetical protein
MKTKPIILFATVLASVALGGCSRETTSSANIRTPGIAALIDVTATDSTNSTVHVELRVGGSSSNTFVNLESGDKLTASAGDVVKDLRSDDAAGEYEAEFATAAAGTEFKVMFEREVDEDALGNRGTMPAPFEITGVPTTTPSRVNDDIVITWDPAESGASMEIEVTGSCIFSKPIDVPGDKGTHNYKRDAGVDGRRYAEGVRSRGDDDADGDGDRGHDLRRRELVPAPSGPEAELHVEAVTCGQPTI